MTGGGSLLARLRRGRLARPLRRQLVRRRRDVRVAARGRASRRRALFRNEDGRFDGRQRGRGRGLRRPRDRAASPPTSTPTATRICTSRRADRAAAPVERRRRHVHGGARTRASPRSAGTRGAAVGDVNGDGRPDLVVAGYADPDHRSRTPRGVSRDTYSGVRDLLFLNAGTTATLPRGRRRGRARGREASPTASASCSRTSTLDGDLDIYLANDTNPNRLYKNVAWPGGAAGRPGRARASASRRSRPARRGRLRARAWASPSGDYDGDGRPDLFVTNSRGQGHGVYPDRSRPTPTIRRSPTCEPTSGSTSSARPGWGVSWADLDLDTDLDLVLVNGYIPVTDLGEDAERVQAFENCRRRGSGPVRGRARRGAGRRSAADRAGQRGRRLRQRRRPRRRRPAARRAARPAREPRRRRSGWRSRSTAFAARRRVTVTLPDGRKLRRELHAGEQLSLVRGPRLHFGLGDAGSVPEVRVRWPGGEETWSRMSRRTRSWRWTRREEARGARPARRPDRRLLVRRRLDERRLRPRRLHAATPGGPSVARVWDEALFTRSSATCRRRRSTHGTCSTSPPPCGTHGPRTTRRPTAGSCARRLTPTT